MTTEQREWTRLLEWEGCLNARDLGGYATGDGRETRWGAVVRSASLAALSEAGRAAVADYGVRAIVDLRLESERRESARSCRHGTRRLRSALFPMPPTSTL